MKNYLLLSLPCFLDIVTTECTALDQVVPTNDSHEQKEDSVHNFEDKDADLKRSLRGGSYSSYSGGRSSSSSWGGSSYNRNRNYSNNNNSNYNRNSNRRGGGFGRMLGGIAAAFAGLALLGLLFGGGAGVSACLAALCCGAAGAAVGAGAAGAAANNNNNNNYYNQHHQQQPGYMQNNYGQNPQQAFNQSVQQAKQEVENSFAAPNQGNVQPYSGQYTTTFTDPESGTLHNASLCLFFQPDPQRQGFRISGQGSDIDGNTIIEDGFAKYDGSCWWIEKTITGDVGLQVLSRGRFNFYQRTFEGSWLANTMLGGPYSSFSAIMAANNQNQQPVGNMNIANATNIPVVSGMVVHDAQSNNFPSGNNNGAVTVVGKPV